MIRILTALGVAGLMIAAPASAAVRVYTLTADGSSGSLPTGPYGTITVTENAGGLDIVETLNAGFRIHATNGSQHYAFVFSLTGDPNVNVTGLANGFSAVNTSSGTNTSAPSLGSFFTGISCNAACGPGYNGGYASPLSFRITTANALTLASLSANANGIVFASDVVSSANGNPTGNVGALATVTPSVPEPATWGMMMLGFGAMGFAMRRKSVSSRIRFA